MTPLGKPGTVKAPGSFIDWVTYCSGFSPSCLPYLLALATRLLRFGPTVPVAFASASVWQLLQPFAVNSALPAALVVLAPPPAGAVAVEVPFATLASQVSNCCLGTTCTGTRMVEWPRPQSS